MDLPIVCTLSASELQERRRAILTMVRGALRKIAPLPLGYAFTFAPNPETLEQIARVVNMERQCCRFLTFKIHVEPADGPIRLEVTGPTEQAKLAIADFFGDQRSLKE